MTPVQNIVLANATELSTTEEIVAEEVEINEDKTIVSEELEETTEEGIREEKEISEESTSAGAENASSLLIQISLLSFFLYTYVLQST
ncbi:hypothetical protein [Listeria monocytogenes]|uniref:hypothetical protein n=1 Tax=Listeria monocytogenes TaxID=1639 RepID=UPI0010E9A26C|nr:hypothetical protein [Listeria monocytogenes]EAE1300664.1 hypothetical protein [Listeria monocytogenes]EAE8309335.1 hypothetical protein [Listeria monocytogenes]EDH3593751.1 hypothetical protein [Listeria monocytogenes]TYV58652.1 hypothetical protein FZ059_14915 [Listeria monocytogenes]TYV64977.1 hypothetical protein FZ042_10015 [Listeria monocytogenes]